MTTSRCSSNTSSRSIASGVASASMASTRMPRAARTARLARQRPRAREHDRTGCRPGNGIDADRRVDLAPGSRIGGSSWTAIVAAAPESRMGGARNDPSSARAVRRNQERRCRGDGHQSASAEPLSLEAPDRLSRPWMTEVSTPVSPLRVPFTCPVIRTTLSTVFRLYLGNITGDSVRHRPCLARGLTANGQSRCTTHDPSHSQSPLQPP